MIAEQFLDTRLNSVGQPWPWKVMREWLNANLADDARIMPMELRFRDGSRAIRDSIYEDWQAVSAEAWDLVTNA